MGQHHFQVNNLLEIHSLRNWNFLSCAAFSFLPSILSCCCVVVLVVLLVVVAAVVLLFLLLLPEHDVF